MARLNDVPGPTESIEALKRRFVRQNREIARVNSLQSLRIQGLESEVTELLKENAALKEQVISLSHDAQKYEAGRYLCKDIHQYRDKLAARLSELNSLVSEFGKLPEKFLNRVDAAENASSRDSHLAEAEPRLVTRPEDDNRLPTIVEGKYFPRHTLDIEDVETIAEGMQDLDSPNIGPPPVAHFDVDDSLFSESTSHEPAPKTYTVTEDTEDSERPGNRSTGVFHDQQERTARSASLFGVSMPPVISGSKRKFSATDEEEDFFSGNVSIDDDFEFTRSVTGPRKPKLNTTAEVPNDSHEVAGLDKVQKNKPALSKRKVLEPKSTNMIASSPRRKHGGDITKQKADMKEMPPLKNQNETVIVNRVELPEEQWQPRPTKPKKGKQLNSREQKRSTPAVNEPEAADTYNETAKSSEPGTTDEQAATETTHPARQSRRQRGTISYAEPNLRDKMRRSTNEFIDAVVAGQRRASTSQTDKLSQEDVGLLGSTKSKRKSVLTENEKSDPQSKYKDHAGKATAVTESENGQKLADIPKNMVTERKRRTLSANPSDLASPHNNDTKSEPKNKRRSDLATSIRPDQGADSDTSSYPQRRTAHRHSSIAETYDHGDLSRDDSLGDETSENSDSKTSVESPDFTETKKATRKSAFGVTAAETAQATRGQRAAARRRSMLL